MLTKTTIDNKNLKLNNNKIIINEKMNKNKRQIK